MHFYLMHGIISCSSISRPFRQQKTEVLLLQRFDTAELNVPIYILQAMFCLLPPTPPLLFLTF